MVFIQKFAVLFSTAILIFFYQNCGQLSEFEVQKITEQASLSCPMENAQKLVGIDEVLIEDMIVPITQVNKEALKTFWPEKYQYLKNHPERFEGVKTSYSELWDEGHLSLYFDPSVSADAKAKTIAACEKIGSFADIKCSIQDDDQSYPHVRVSQMESGCFATVGKRTYSGTLNIRGSCATEYIITHELMHVLGVKHEHQHPERDKYIRVIEENIKSSYLGNFNLFTPGLVTDFDVDSIMMYRSSAFSKGGSYPAMVRRNPECDQYETTGFPKSCTWGDRKQMSAGDKAYLIALYGPARGSNPPSSMNPPSEPESPEEPSNPPVEQPELPNDPPDAPVDPPEPPPEEVIPIETCPLPEAAPEHDAIGEDLKDF